MIRRTRSYLGLLLAFSSMAGSLCAANYALVVGAGQFPLFKQMRKPDGTYGIDLDGPRPDAEKLVELLATRFHYPRQNMTVLVDQAATRHAILGAIDALIGEVRPGDRVLIYYSGHGTSSLDPGTHGFGMDPTTGAIVPTDLDPKGDVLAQLIVGNRDLRPRFLRLEEKAEVLVVFDACFSGESVKSIRMEAPSVPRFVSLSDLTGNTVASDALIQAERSLSTRSVSGYPYKRIVYYSAASSSEYAQDIGVKAIQALGGRFTTVDGRPHGAFSNALFRALEANNAAENGNCTALFARLRDLVFEQTRVSGLPAQHPQMLAPLETPDAAAAGCFATSEIPRPPAPAAKSKTRMALDSLAEMGGNRLSCRLSKPDYRDGEATTLACSAPAHGFVTIIGYGEGEDSAVILTPNRYQPSGEVAAGEFRIPGAANYRIVNHLPSGADEQEQVMLVLFDTEQIDLRKLGAPKGAFTNLPESAMPAVKGQVVEGYDAAELVFRIHR